MNIKVNKTFATICVCVFKVAYFAFCTLYIAFPIILAVLILPDVAEFLIEVGRKLKLLPSTLMNFSYVCGVLNIAFVVWHFLIKTRRTDIFDQAWFHRWLIVSNITLVVWALALVLQSFGYGGGKMGN